MTIRSLDLKSEHSLIGLAEIVARMTGSRVPVFYVPTSSERMEIKVEIRDF